MMKSKDLKNKSLDELKSDLRDSLKEHFSLRMQKSISQLRDTSQLTKVRRNIARLKTIINQKESNNE